MDVIFYFLPLWVLCGLAGIAIGSRKGIAGFGFLLGFVLGPIGILLVVIDNGKLVKCLNCCKLIDPEATICPYCRSTINQLPDFREIPPPKFKTRLASKVLQIHQSTGTTYALVDISRSPTYELMRDVDHAYEELEQGGFVERAGREVEPYPGGPKRPLRRITARGKTANVA